MAVEFPPEFPFDRPAVGSTPQKPAEAVPPAAPPIVATRPNGPERRRAPRQTLVAKASVRPDSPVTIPSLVSSGFVSNISMNGIGFHVRKPLAIGEKYRITLEVGPLKWSSRLRVVSCRHHAESETFDIGAEFIGNELSRHLQAA